ncbi:hypothetical protein AM500_14170 [Bacillus sp. FJAT-18017]|uniref:STAS domain-containing protein n=1 Tax=Bacillus sp. FJAT-18017 TaxID=1705566 RepID=UPI0006AF9975|nr:STAS domain-containing protein [Bacillus sp. FJAT-18017]ALC90806.1 hypothetical protein AM500_14170 [Bacillus sp. FJAT-18017]
MPMKLSELKQHFSDKIEENSELLTEILMKEMSQFYNYEFVNEEAKERTTRYFYDLVRMVSEGLKDEDVKEQAFKWGEGIGFYSVENNGDLGNTIKGATVYKNVIWSFIFEEGKKINAEPDDMLHVISEIDHIFNMMVHGFSTAFTSNAEKLLKESRDLYLKISVPIVPITQKLAVLPLIGEINEMRSETLIVDTLDTCVNKRLETLVIDLSGVVEVDLIGIEVLFKLLRSLNLLGVKPVITGMRGEISKTFVNLGINLENIAIHSNLEQALKELEFF